MKLYRPSTMREAVDLVAGDDEARYLAGGATLVAMMNADLIRPSALISLRDVEELRGIRKGSGGELIIGAMTTHQEVSDFDGFSGAQRLLGQAAGCVGHPPIRVMGTIGGSLAHGDPAADYPAVLLAADAVFETIGPEGERRIPAAEFFLDFFENVLAPGELVRAVSFPPGPPEAVSLYNKLARTDGDFATVSVALVLAMSGQKCTHLGLAAGGCNSVPVRVAAAEECLINTSLSHEDVDRAAALLCEACDPLDDLRASAGYRLKVLGRMVDQAVETARNAWEEKYG
jgi:carbon-monoxide dehydrogenase medium subunit